MSNNRIKKPTKPILLSLSLSMLLLFSSSCMITGESEAEIIEEVVQKIASMDGKMTVVSKDGETITLTITKETSEDSSNHVDLSSILPSLGCIEDVFKVLGVWEDAHALREEGLHWSHVAEELGYTKDKMHAQLLEIAEVRLREAKESGLIDHEMVEKKLAYFSEIALKWVHKIFTDTEKSTVDLSSILPSLGCIEDVFKVLGVWEDAHALREEGLHWSHVAEELGYTKDTMHAQLLEVAEVRLKEAKESGLIDHEMVEKKLAYFSEIALKWMHKIFTE